MSTEMQELLGELDRNAVSAEPSLAVIFQDAAAAIRDLQEDLRVERADLVATKQEERRLSQIIDEKIDTVGEMVVASERMARLAREHGPFQVSYTPDNMPWTVTLMVPRKLPPGEAHPTEPVWWYDHEHGATIEAAATALLNSLESA